MTTTNTDVIKHKGKQKKVTEELLGAVITEYIRQCEDKKKVPFMLEVAQILDIDSGTLSGYMKTPAYAKHIKKLKSATELALLRKVSDENKPVGGIFLLKAMFKYIEQQKVDITTNGETLGVIQLPSRSPKT